MTAAELRPWLDALIAADSAQAYVDGALVGMDELVRIAGTDGEAKRA